jgi:Carboxypeptidase regulatory-like domain/TonB-dependent Receptor Plug Domain
VRLASAFAAFVLIAFSISVLGHATLAQSGGNSSNISGTVTDPSGAVIPGATVTIHNPVSQFERTATTDATGNFGIANVPFNPYHMTVAANGFQTYVQDVDVRSSVPLNLKIALTLGAATSSVTVEAAGDLLETDSTAHTDVDRQLFNEVPLESASSSVSALVTQTSPGVAADSNGLFHGLGDHAENSFSVDGQPITDQQSKVFSNQIPIDSIQSLEVIDGAPPAEYGDKTSLVIDVTTRSGQGMTTPHGSITTSYGAFGTADTSANFGYGGQNWGNFISVSGLNSGRFLDPPEFSVIHDKGNEENAFDRLDFQLKKNDSLHINLGFSRSWFQTPDSFDELNSGVTVGQLLGTADPALTGPADQRSQIRTFNVAPSWNHLIGSSAVLTAGLFVRHDQYNYYPSDDPLADLGPVDLQRESVSQLRFLTNAGARASVSWVKGIHNIKAGVTFEHTFVTEDDHLGIVDPTLNAPCLAPATAPSAFSFVPVAGFTSPLDCPAGDEPNTAANPNSPAQLGSVFYPNFDPTLAPFDLTRGGGLFAFRGHADVKETALYLQDTITKGSWSFNLGMRGDFYNGLTEANQAEPRLGVAYHVAPSNTVLRVSYARTLETPFNENLVLSSEGCASAVLNPLLLCSSSALSPLSPGFRNEFHAGLQQAFGKHIVFDGEYIWKYTHNGYDFSVLGNTPITFPIEWHNSKIPGFTARTNLTNLHGFTAYVVMSSVAARFFTPQIGGAGSVPVASGPGEFTPFRIDHDERFNQTTHLQYQPWKRGPWFGFNWRYDSGLVAGATPCYGVSDTNSCPQSFTGAGGAPFVDPQCLTLQAVAGGCVPLTADQEFEAGFFCGGVRATPTQSIPDPCPAAQFGSNLIRVPMPGTENDDKNPPRIAPRNLFDIAIGDDNLFNAERYKWSARLTVINLANDYALYNFLSTFSGTHYVTPRAITAEIGFHF